MLYDPRVLAEIRTAIPAARWTSDARTRPGTTYHGTGAKWRFLVIAYVGGHVEATAWCPEHVGNGHGVAVSLPPDLALEACQHAMLNPFDPKRP